MAGGITGTHVQDELDPAGDANAQDAELQALRAQVNALLAAQPTTRDLGTGPAFPSSGPGGTPLQDGDAFDKNA